MLLGELPEDVAFLDSLNEKADVIHAFVKSAAEMETALFEFKDKIAENGAIWISWCDYSTTKQGLEVASTD